MASSLEQSLHSFSEEKRTTRFSGWNRLIGDLGGRFNAGIYFLIAIGAILLAYRFTPSFVSAHVSESHANKELIAVVYAGIFVLVSFTIGMLDSRRQGSLVMQIGRVWVASFLALLLLVTFFGIVRYEQIGRYILTYSWVFTVGIGSTYAWIMWQLCARLRPRVLLIGDREFCDRAEEFFVSENRPIELRSLPIEQLVDGIPATLRDSKMLKTWVKENDVDNVIYQNTLVADLEPVVAKGLCEGLHLSAYSEYVELYYGRTVPSEIPQSWLFANSLGCLRPRFQLSKRVIDILLSVTGLLLVSPFLGLAALLVKLTDGGPVLYSQIRVGLGGEPFQIFKLRSMVVESEKEGAQWASKNDSRVTWIGKILRKTRMDEVPQFWNILRGDMSFVGPRPERPEFVEILSEAIPHYDFRQLVKPGLTGWAQVNYPYGASVEDAAQKLAYDLFYVKNASLSLDLQVVLKTMGVVMKGAR